MALQADVIKLKKEIAEVTGTEGTTHLIWREGQTKEEALKAYQREIKETDKVVFICWNQPHECADEPPTKGEDYERGTNTSHTRRH